MFKKLKNLKLEKALKDETTLKIISLFIAIIAFVGVNQIGNPLWLEAFRTTEYVQSVPIRMVFDDEKFVVSGMPNSIPVNIIGSQSEVRSEMNRIESLYGTLPLSYNKPGEYQVGFRNIEFNVKSNVKVRSVISEFNIKVQRKVVEEKQVDINYINGAGLGNGFLLKTPQISNSIVKVTGGSDDVDSISTLMGFVDLSKLVIDESNPTQDFEVRLVPYDKDGNIVNRVQLEVPTIQVKQPYEVSTVELPVNYEFVNNKTGKFVASICAVELKDICDEKFTPTVKVYGDSEKINNLDNITYKVDLDGFKGNQGEVKGTPIIDSGVFVLGDYEKKFNVKLEKGITKTIKNVQPRLIGLSSSLQAKVVSSSYALIDVKVTGAASVVNALTPNDISLSLDLTNINKPGTYTLPIKVQRKKNFDYTLSSEVVTIQVEEVK